MTWGQLGGRTVGPVLDDQLALIVQLCAELLYVTGVFLIVPIILVDIRRIGHLGVKLVSRGQREGHDKAPVRADTLLRHASRANQRLPVVRATEVKRQRWAQVGPRRYAKHHGVIARLVTRIIRIGACAWI